MNSYIRKASLANRTYKNPLILWLAILFLFGLLMVNNSCTQDVGLNAELQYNPTYPVTNNQPSLSQEVIAFLAEPIACQTYKGMVCKGKDYNKVYEVIVAMNVVDLNIFKNGIKDGSIIDISASYPLEIGDWIAFAKDDQAFIRFSHLSPSHMLIIED